MAALPPSDADYEIVGHPPNLRVLLKNQPDWKPLEGIEEEDK